MKRYRQMTAILFMALLIFSLAWAVEAAEGGKSGEGFPFYPSLLNTSTGQPVSGDEYEPPSRCRGCHKDLYNQWYGSMHSNALRDPVFMALWKMGAKETNGEIDKLCLGCHTAIGVVTNEAAINLETMEFTASDIAWDGVQCDFCHTIKELNIFNTPTLDPQNASIILEPGDVKRGPYKDSVSPGHETAYSEIHTKAEFCGSCHNVFHPVTHFPIERTYEEWKISVYARAGIQCQDCHMMPLEVAQETARTLKKGKNSGKASPMGPVRELLYTHEFVGANFTVTEMLDSDNHAEIARKRLQGAADLDVIVPGEAAAGEMVTVKVKVTNVGAGHNLPTSLTEIRQMWLDVSVLDASGREIFRSGALDGEGNVDPEAVMFRSSAVDNEGHHTVKPWEISHFEYNNTIPPKGYALEKYNFLVSDGTAGPLKIKAALRYRSYSQELADLLLGEEAGILPVVDMTVEEQSLAIK